MPGKAVAGADDDSTVGEGCEGGEEELIVVDGCEKMGLGGDAGDCVDCWPLPWLYPP
jgi:hypothetical protein